MPYMGMFIESWAPTECFVWRGASDTPALREFLAETEFEIAEERRHAIDLRSRKTGVSITCYTKTWVCKRLNGRLSFIDSAYDKSHERLTSLADFGHANAWKSSEQLSWVADESGVRALSDADPFPEERWASCRAIVLSAKRWREFAAAHQISADEGERWKPMERMRDA